MNQPPAPVAKPFEILPPQGQVYSLWEFARLTPGQFDVICQDHGDWRNPGDVPPLICGTSEVNRAIPPRKLIQFIAADLDEAQRRWNEYVSENYLHAPHDCKRKGTDPLVRKPGSLCPQAPTVILSRQEVIHDYKADEAFQANGFQFPPGMKKKMVAVVAKRYGGGQPEFPEMSYFAFAGKPKADADLVPLSAEIQVIPDPEGDVPEEANLPKIVVRALFTYAVKPTAAC